MSEEIKVPLSIDCWSCGTHMTLLERAENDGDCPRCDSEIDLEVYLAKALAGYAERDSRIAELEAERNKLENDLMDTELRALKWYHQINAHVDIYRELKNERDQLRAELAEWSPVMQRLGDENQQLRAELAAIKAQEPVAYVQTIPTAGHYPCKQRLDRDNGYTIPLYAAPVAKQVVMPEPVLIAGNWLSNAAYNLAQKNGHALTEEDCELLSCLRKRWDQARLNAADQEGGQDE